VTQHPPGSQEHNRETEQNNQQPQKQEAQPKAIEHPQFIPFRKPQVDPTSIVDPNARYTKGNCKPGNSNIRRLIGNHLAFKDGAKCIFTAACSNPQLKRIVTSSLEEENRVVSIPLRWELIRDLAPGQFGNFADDATVESILGRALGNVSKDLNLSCQPRITAPLNVALNESLQNEEDQHGTKGKSQAGPKRDAPRGAAQLWISGL
jgi:hypothetical protein